MTWTYVRRRTDGNLVQDSWTLNSGGTSYLTGTYNDVPLTTNNSGKDAKATIVVNSSGVVTNVTITAFGTAFNVGDTISAADKAGVLKELDYVSTAGGAFLEFIEGRNLPSLEALQLKWAK